MNVFLGETLEREEHSPALFSRELPAPSFSLRKNKETASLMTQLCGAARQCWGRG